MTALSTEPRLPQPVADELYAELVAALRGMDEAAALKFSAALVLLLVNELADPERVRRAIALAREATVTDADGA